MANEKITYRSLFKKTFNKKGWFKKYALFTLVILALAFVTSYLNYEVPFLGALLLIIFLIPLIITFTEYSALVETNSPLPRNFRGFRMLFTNTYRSGRVRIILTFKLILKYFFYMLIGMFLSGLIFYFIIATFDAGLLSEIQTAMTAMINSETPEQILENSDILFGLITNYEAPFLIVNQLIAGGILVTFVNQGIFRVFTSIFIQQQPMTSLESINKRFFSDNESKKVLRKANFINVLIVLLTYALVYTASFLLLYFYSKNQGSILQLQAELISLVVLVGFLPLVIRFNFYMYQALAKTKEIQIVEFNISELKSILRSPLIPEEARPYIAELLKAKKSELEQLLSIANKEEAKSSHANDKVDDENVEENKELKD